MRKFESGWLGRGVSEADLADGAIEHFLCVDSIVLLIVGAGQLYLLAKPRALFFKLSDLAD